KSLINELKSLVISAAGGNNLNFGLKELYRNCFMPRQYHDTYYSVLDEEVAFFLDCYSSTSYEVLGKSFKTKDGSLAVADVGCGPVPIYAAAATAHLQQPALVCLADMLPQNRTALRCWQSNGDAALDWSVFFERISLHPPAYNFDVVMSTLCLEFATSSVEEYEGAVARLASHVVEGGYLIMAGALDNTHYVLGSKNFPSVALSEAIVGRAIALCHLTLVLYRSLPRTTHPDQKPADHSGVFFAVAMK
ncbi:Methyltransferase NNMT/PNMT/TEMT, partial [Trinorchestia longiramus]